MILKSLASVKLYAIFLARVNDALYRDIIIILYRDYIHNFLWQKAIKNYELYKNAVIGLRKFICACSCLFMSSDMHVDANDARTRAHPQRHACTG